ncbi:MAG: bacteriocin [Clostridia bacterium]|nr:bacteriocin [Clostridia bacterium]
MDEKKKLNDEELEEVSGGADSKNSVADITIGLHRDPHDKQCPFTDPQGDIYYGRKENAQ